MHSTGPKKNAVQKSYAMPVFLVNEKCTLITQVWQNLALPFAPDCFLPIPAAETGRCRKPSEARASTAFIAPNGPT
jgi:hypothetical protein